MGEGVDDRDKCRHCGGSTGQLTLCGADGNVALLHPECRDAWFAQTDDLSIPQFLQREAG